MRISLPNRQEPHDVMSLGDSVVKPDTNSPATTTAVNLSVDTLTSNPPIATMRHPTFEVLSTREQTLEGSVDLEENGTEEFQFDLSESNDNLKMGITEVVSLDAISLEGDLGDKKDDDKSAFAIVSIGVADDSLPIITKGESGSEEDSVSLSEDNQAKASVLTTLPENEQTSSGIVPPGSDGSSTQSSPSVTQKLVPNSVGSTSVPLSTAAQIVPSVASNQGNGTQPGPGQRRFKWVNMYDRGRWTVKDMANTEESQKDQRHYSSSERSNSQDNSVVSPPTARKVGQLEWSDNESGPLASASVVGLLGDVLVEQDTQLDKSSTAAESNLSRTASLSSMSNTEDLCQGFETESVASASSSVAGRERDILDATLTTQVASDISNTANVPFLSSVFREQPHISSGSTTTAHGPNCTCDMCTESHSKGRESNVPQANKDAQEPQPALGTASVQSAMQHLQMELDQLLTTNVDVGRQRGRLVDENKRLHVENSKLKNEMSLLRSTLGEENTVLKKKLFELKSTLAKLSSDPEQVSAGLGISPPHSKT